MMRSLYLIRHGQASFGKDNYDRLSDLGLEQAHILGDCFAKQGLRFDALYSGSMVRQIDTATTVMSRLGKNGSIEAPMVLPEFDEFDASFIITSQIDAMSEEDPSMSEAFGKIYTDRRSLQMILETAVMRWISGRYEIPGVETWSSFQSRVKRGVLKIMHDNQSGKKVALFTSGGPMSAVVQIALGLSNEKTIQLAWQILNTAVSTFRFNTDRLSLTTFNSIAHLRHLNNPDMVTYR
jgi:broad specificity phosphatase PhoE